MQVKLVNATGTFLTFCTISQERQMHACCWGRGRSFENHSFKQANKWIGDQTATLFRLFIAFLSWPNLTCVNRPLSPFFYHPTTPGFPLFCWFFSELKINSHKKEGGQIIELFIAYLTSTWPNLTCWSKHLNSFFHRLTPPVGEPLWKFERTVFQ